MARCCFYILIYCLFFVCSCATTQKETEKHYVNPVIPIPSGYSVCKIDIFVKERNNFPSINIENIWKEFLLGKGYVVVSRQTDLRHIEEEIRTQGQYISSRTRDPSMLGNISTADAILIIEATTLEVYSHDGWTDVSDIAIVGRLIDVRSGNLIWIKNVSWVPDNSTPSGGIAVELLKLPFIIIQNVLIGGCHEDKVMSAVVELMKRFPRCRC